jgi:hypothetical protein
MNEIFPPTLSERIACALGLHDWYLGQYANPVWGRTERRCLNCHKRQYATYSPARWVTYKPATPEATSAEGEK